MRKRVQVVFDPSECRQIVRIAKARSLTVSAWVRRVLHEAARAEPTVDRGRKLAAIRIGAACAFPTADIDHMLAEIDRGHPGVDRLR